MTTLPVRQSIEEYGSTAVARAMGLPISTINTWRARDEIPGASKDGTVNRLHVLKVRAFEAAIKQLRRAAKPKRRAAA